MFYVTTPIYYVNDRPHIGHCYTTLLADVAARFARLREGPDAPERVFFLTGTDEHAEKVVASAREHGVSVQEWADRNAEAFRRAFAQMGFSNDDFVRTSEARHKERASAYIRRLMDAGYIELGDYEGWYDPSQEEYVTETVAKEHDYTSPVTGRPLEKRTEQNYFFRLDRPEFSAWLVEVIERGERGEEGGLRIEPEARRNEVLGRIRQGLQRVPVSRRVKEGDADWGILMPGDPGHRVYVWIEALCNYLTTVDTPERRRFWPAAGQGESTIVHMMAKDILWFHAVIWPCMLRALGERPPSVVYAHGYWIREGRKMSKSLGNFIEIEQLMAYADRFSLDGVRWYLATQGPMGANDADFAHRHFVETYNADLANGIGNSASRVSNMIAKYLDGELPRTCDGRFGFPEGRALQAALRARELAGTGVEDPTRTFDFARLTRERVARAIDAFERLRLDEMLLQGRAIVREVDDFISYSAPFTLAKKAGEIEHADKALATILYSCAEALRIASLLLYPACPQKMADLWRDWRCDHLSDPADANSPFREPLESLCAWGRLGVAHRIEKGAPLFMRADPEAPPPDAAGEG